MSRIPLLFRVTAAILLIIVFFYLLVIGRDFIYPIALAILFSYLLYPMAQWIEDRICPRPLAIFFTVIIALVVSVGVLTFLYTQISFFVEQMPSFASQAVQNINAFQGYLENHTPIDFANAEGLKERLVSVLRGNERLPAIIFDATTGTVFRLGIQPVYVFFMLYYRDRFKEFLYKVFTKEYHNRLSKVLEQISEVTKNYVSGVFIVVSILCVLNSLGLMIVGIEYAVMFGILSALMNFIPYFGTLIGGAIPLVFTLFSDSPEKAIGIIILFVIIQFTENNILTPNITGGRVAVNPLFTILVIILGGMIWGIPGMFVSVPFLGMFKVVCQNIPMLEPVAYILAPKAGVRKFLDWKNFSFRSKEKTIKADS